jgi:tRNA(Met) C34 N-acetyltransferase TmcA
MNPDKYRFPTPAIKTNEFSLIFVFSEQISPYDMKRLELYGNNMADYHLVTDLLPNLARLFFLFGLSNEVHLSALQQAILLGVGLQVKKNNLS